jgi:MHS family proline/betaine transporter-like MFS transporter
MDPHDSTPAAIGADTTTVATPRRAVVAACVGNFIEYYDFVVYGYFATTIAALFFPAQDPTASLLLTFAAFAVSYAARPLGALIFGRIGDRYGRKTPLTVAILLIATCTTVIGLLPTYEAIGVAAPIILTVARLLQGISVGGEYGGALAFIAESAPSHRRSFYTGWQTFTIGLALLVGAAVASLMTATMDPEALQSWGWRIPFLAGLPLGFVGLYMRLRLEETPHFKSVQEQLATEKAPLRRSVRMEWRALLLGMGMIATPSYCIYIYFIYSPTYLQAELGYSAAQAQSANLLSLIFYCALLPFFAHLGDRVGRRPLIIIGASAVAVVTYPAFLVLDSGDIVTATIALCVMGLCFAPISAVALAGIAEVFPTTFRYTGASLSLNIPVTLLGGTAPLIATALIGVTGIVATPALLVVAGGIISAITGFAMTETANRRLREVSTGPDRQPAARAPLTTSAERP